MTRSTFLRVRASVVAMVVASVGAAAAYAQQPPIKASIAPGAKPAWEKGIVGITPESYYNAIECGKQPGNPACLFWDADLCQNPDFELAVNTPYKAVAYEVWYSVRQKKPAPQPNYQAAQQARVTVGVTAIRARRMRSPGSR
jgi:hypothetical protein